MRSFTLFVLAGVVALCAANVTGKWTGVSCAGLGFELGGPMRG